MLIRNSVAAEITSRNKNASWFTKQHIRDVLDTQIYYSCNQAKSIWGLFLLYQITLAFCLNISYQDFVKNQNMQTLDLNMLEW